jgi:hypothetical protein
VKLFRLLLAAATVCRDYRGGSRAVTKFEDLPLKISLHSAFMNSYPALQRAGVSVLRITSLIFTKFGINIVPLEVTPTSYFQFPTVSSRNMVDARHMIWGYEMIY